MKPGNVLALSGLARWAGVALVILLAQSRPSAAGLAPGEVKLIALDGTAEALPTGSRNWFLLLTNQVLHAGDRLKVGVNSRATLLWSDNSVIHFEALTEMEILPPDSDQSLSGLRLMKGILSFFHRDEPGRIRVITRGAVAGIRGTEFALAIEGEEQAEQTRVSVIDGVVELTNAEGALVLTNGEAAVAALGQRPRRAPGFVVNNIIQWSFYYPAVLDLEDLQLPATAKTALGASLAAYRTGDLRNAVAKYLAGRSAESDDEKIYRATLLLSAGQVPGAERELSSLTAGGSDRVRDLSAALGRLVAAVKRQAAPSVSNEDTATALLASSYYEQARAGGEVSLRNALVLARRAAERSPNFGYAWARVAELEFSFGRREAALDALERSLALSPYNAEALALKGFLLAAKDRAREAQVWFDRAIEADPALGNAWLGRGLCRIRRGDTRGGKEDILIAAAAEPQRAFLRSYLGKALDQVNDRKKAVHELELAKSLDPADPTPWLYSALLNERNNRINDAVDDLEKSLELNNNRQLYRSEFLLDEDRAVRSASLAAIYQQVGMTNVSLREAARAVTYDYANYSAHLFLANSFDALRDPTRFNLRYETPWFNELLLANLLSPPGVSAISPNISQQEYYRLFEQNRLGLSSTTDLRSDGEYREIVSQFGLFGALSYSLDLDWQHNEGVRPNNYLTRSEWYSQVKLQLTPKDSLFFLTKYEDYHSGDNFQYFDPSARTITTNSLTSTVTTNVPYRPFFRYDEFQTPIAIGAYHHEWAPGIHTLALGGRLETEQKLSDKAVPMYVFLQPGGTLGGVATSDFDVTYHTQLEIWIAELNQIFQVNRNTLILGGRYQGGRFDTQNTLTNTTIFADFFPPVVTNVTAGMERWSIYGYNTWEAVPMTLWLTAGLSYDHVDYPANFRQVPITPGETSANLLGPKGALIWSPLSIATLRVAYSKSLGGVSLDESYRLEPSQLAGFNQSYRTIISESEVGSVSAPKIETFGSAIDLKFPTRTYLGLIGQILNSDVDRQLGIYRFPDPVTFAGVPSSTLQQLRYQEYSAEFVANQLVSKEWALGFSYKFTRSELKQRFPEVPVAISDVARRLDESDLHTVSGYVLYQHPSGWFARVEANWYLQENVDRLGTQPHMSSGDDFAQVDAWIGFRFRRGFGDLSVGVLNINDSNYKLSPLTPYNELPRERTVAGRVRLRF